MLVQCPCGKKLKVNDSQVGKKVRCPKCEEVFVVEEAGDDAEEGIQAEPKRPRGRSEEEPSRKKKATREEEPGDDADENEDGGETSASTKKGKRGSAPKKGVSLVRNIVSAVVLVALLAVVGFIYWRQFSKPGTLKLQIWVNGGELTLNGKKQPYDPIPTSFDTRDLLIDLRPGNYQIKFTKDGYQPFTTDVTVKSGEEPTIQIRPQRLAPPPRKGPP